MNNEPVAWFYERPGETGKFMCGDAEAMKGIEKDGWVTTPLYLHPVKELTEEEIKSVMGLDECWIGEDCSMPNMIAFAKAILKKAREK